MTHLIHKNRILMTFALVILTLMYTSCDRAETIIPTLSNSNPVVGMWNLDTVNGSPLIEVLKVVNLPNSMKIVAILKEDNTWQQFTFIASIPVSVREGNYQVSQAGLTLTTLTSQNVGTTNTFLIPNNVSVVWNLREPYLILTNTKVDPLSMPK